MTKPSQAMAGKAMARRASRGHSGFGIIAVSAALLAGCGGGSETPTDQQGGGTSTQAAQLGRVQAAAVTSDTAGAPYVTDAMSDNQAGVQVPALGDWDTSRLYYRPNIKGVVRYVDSNTGQDIEASAGGGTMVKPWKTLSFARSRLAGVNMLLLRCGGIWRDHLNMDKPPAGLVVGGYDVEATSPTTLKACTGDKRPLILGSNALTPSLWQPAGLADATIYKYPLTDTSEKAPDAMFYMGRPMLKARWPNIVGPDANWPREGGVIGKEFAKVAELKDSENHFYKDRFKVTPSDLAILKDKDLVGATVHVHTEAWLLESAKVKSFDKDTGIVILEKFFNFWGDRKELVDGKEVDVTGFENAIQPNSGYILEGKDWMLDAPGEWLLVQDATTGSAPYILAKLPLNGVGQAQDPRTLAKPTPTMTVAPLEIAVRNVGVEPRLGGAKIQIERVQVERFTKMGIHANQSPAAVIKDVTVRHTPIGILASREKANKTLVAGPNIQHSLVQYTSYAGISVVNFENTVVAYNQALDTGIYTSTQGFEQAPSIGATGAIHVSGKGALVEHNLVNRASNAGIIVQNSFLPEHGLIGVRIQHNTVRRPCVRVTDCGGIYISGNFADIKPDNVFPTTEETYYQDPDHYKNISPKPRGATINNNVVYNAASNMDGKYGTVRDGAVGIYLDALSARATVRDNLISSTETGIKLHNAYDNLVTGNTVRSVTYTSLQAAQSDIKDFTQNVMWGNIVENNHFYSHRTMTGASSLPSDGSKLGLEDQKAFAQQWGRSIDPNGTRTKELFTDIDTGWATWGKKPGNISRNNDVLTTAGQSGNSWHSAKDGTSDKLIQSAGAVWTSGVGTIPPQLTLQAWQEMTTSNDTVQPSSVSFKVFTTTGASDVALNSSWGSYLDPNGVGSSLNDKATCPSMPSPQPPCVQLVSAAVNGKTTDHVYRQMAPVTVDTADNLYLVRYTAETGAGGAIPTAVVRQAGSPWTNLGMYTPLDTVLKSGQVMRVEQFFRFKQSEEAAAVAFQVLPQNGQINPEAYFGQVSVTKVPYQGLSLLTPATLRGMTRHILNPTSQPISVSSCGNLGWPAGCTVLNEQGQAQSWPISVPARGGVFLLRRDDTWMQFAGS